MRFTTLFALAALPVALAQTWPFPDPSKIKMPSRNVKAGDKERIQITIDYSRCTGGGYRYDIFAIGYDEYSVKEIEGHSRKEASTTADQYYFKYHIDIPANGWNGRFMLTDQPEFPRNITNAGVRVMTDLSKGFDMWPDANPDEETGMNRTFIAPLTYYYWSTTPTADRHRGSKDENRGFAFNRHVEADSTITGYIQWC